MVCTNTFDLELTSNGGAKRMAWEALFLKYKQEYPDLARQIELMNERQMPENWDANLPVFPANDKGLASRESNGKIMQFVADAVPFMLGGSADWRLPLSRVWWILNLETLCHHPRAGAATRAETFTSDP
jgi:transketolase